MDRKVFWTGGALIGASLMAIFDPERGRKRRAVLRDKASGAAGTAATAAGKTWRDLRHRAEGVAARGRALFDRGAGERDVLAARVRSRLGRLTSHPRAIAVDAEEGRIILSGPVLSREAEAVVAGVRAVRGVTAVEDLLERHESSDGVPVLQGAGRTRMRSPLRENWSPTARLLGGAAGAGLIVAGARRRGWAGGGLALLGLGLLSRAASNRPVRRMLRVARSRSTVEARSSMSIEAPVSEVYAFWQRWANLPRFLEHVRDVRDEGGGWTRWTVGGPGGTGIVFDAVVTATIPNHLIAWKTAPRQPVRQSGLVRFDEILPGVTRVDVQISYDRPAGELGHSVASLFGRDPEASLEEGLRKMKSLLEQARGGNEGDAAWGAMEPSRQAVPFVEERSERGGAGSAEEALRVPAAEETPVRREESLVPRPEAAIAARPEDATAAHPEDATAPHPEDAIIAAQDAGVAPLIQEEPGQTDPVRGDAFAAPGDRASEDGEGAAAQPKRGRRRTRKKPPEAGDQVDF